MKVITFFLGALLLISFGCAADEKLTLKGDDDKQSYALGLEIGNNLRRQPMDLNPEIVAQGLQDALAGGETLMTEQEASDTMAALRKEMAEKQITQMKEKSEKNKAEGEAFLEENRKKEGVVTLPSGLQYKVIQEGTGKTPLATDTVTVHYKGTLIDGTEFDSSHRRGQPASFPVTGVIRGWTEALQLMKEGARWQLFIPSELAYGERGAGRDIGPHATLIFEVELISIADQSSQ